MRRQIQYGLIAGAVIVAGVGVAGASMQSTASHPPAQAHAAGQPSHGRGGQRFLTEYDLNHDGKVTRDEFNKVVVQRFSQSTHGGKLMDESQFQGFRTRSLQQHADQSFRRADWNGDGKLTFDEFANPIRVSFERADKQSAGVIFCHKAADGGNPQPRHGRRSARGAGNFCSRDDLNHDGKITRSELDQALHQQFAAAAKSGSSMTRDQFVAMQHSRAKTTSSRAFGRLDDNHDGKLTAQEFTAYQQRTFARMDKNGDGVITRDEMTYRRSHGNQPRRRG